MEENTRDLSVSTKTDVLSSPEPKSIQKNDRCPDPAGQSDGPEKGGDTVQNRVDPDPTKSVNRWTAFVADLSNRGCFTCSVVVFSLLIVCVAIVILFRCTVAYLFRGWF